MMALSLPLGWKKAVESLFLDPTLILIIAALAGFFMAFGIGANDVANAMGTSVGSRAITLKQAVIIAAIFEFLGAYLAGGEVTSTIRKGIVDPNLYSENNNLFIIGMISSLLAGASWLFFASRRRNVIGLRLSGGRRWFYAKGYKLKGGSRWRTGHGYR